MLTALAKEDALPFKYVLADTIYGASPELIAAVEALGKTYSVSVAKDTLCWLKQPMKKHTVETLIQQIIWRQTQNHRSYLSHRKRAMQEADNAP